MHGRAPLQCFSETKDWRVAKPEHCMIKLNSHRGLGLYVGPSHPKTMSEMTKPLCKERKMSKLFYLVDPGEHSNFSAKKDVWCNIVERPFFNIQNQFVIARVPRR